MSTFQIQGEQFLLDGKPFRIRSGAIHYFRVVPEYWEDRLLKLKACGMNVVETYVAWNIHEPKEGSFHFEGMADLVRFITLAQQLGLYVIVRPGPFICAEWEFGGFPAWLLEVPDIQLRSYNRPFLQKVDAYFDVLMDKLRPLLCTQGGPVIALQVENEYGTYGEDKAYLEYLRDGMVRRNMDVLLFTSDGAWNEQVLENGRIQNVWMTVNFGSKHGQAFDMLRKFQPDQPIMCMEFWDGWFDQWGVAHHTRETQSLVDELEPMLQMKAHMNFYMFHGGTNFGFLNGANCETKYEPTITSYDYSALLSEAGDITDNYLAVQRLLAEYEDVQEAPLPKPIPKKAYGSVQLLESAPLFRVLDSLTEAHKSEAPMNMEYYGQNYGYILYRTTIPAMEKPSKLQIPVIHDRAQIYLNGCYKGVLERNHEQDDTIVIDENGGQLDILVENMGRVNYGEKLFDKKGIIGDVLLGEEVLRGWTVYPLSPESLESLELHHYAKHTPTEGPAFYRGSFEAEELADTFLELDGWTKGVVFLNGFHLGRYWNIGPQLTLYVPAPLLRSGTNEIVVFELHGVKEPRVQLIDRHKLDFDA